ncbi:hypothetical protein BDZ89DRAFT_720042 [Hymenopellis radicata]|nr:hypothetical protein BDZ89DRAFT_720042 [Hymenopellis radicata]
MGYVTADLLLLLPHLSGCVSSVSSGALRSGDTANGFYHHSRTGGIHDMSLASRARCAPWAEDLSNWLAGTI